MSNCMGSTGKDRIGRQLDVRGSSAEQPEHVLQQSMTTAACKQQAAAGSSEADQQPAQLSAKPARCGTDSTPAVCPRQLQMQDWVIPDALAGAAAATTDYWQ